MKYVVQRPKEAICLGRVRGCRVCVDKKFLETRRRLKGLKLRTHGERGGSEDVFPDMVGTVSAYNSGQRRTIVKRSGQPTRKSTLEASDSNPKPPTHLAISPYSPEPLCGYEGRSSSLSFSAKD